MPSPATSRKPGRDVPVAEQLDRLGGGSRTEELLPGYLFDTHSVAHNLIQATGIVEELRLAEAGLRYTEMDPFSVAPSATLTARGPRGDTIGP